MFHIFSPPPRESDRTIALYPSADSISVSQLVERWNLPSSSSSRSHDMAPNLADSIPPLNIVLLDATWSQARNLNRNLPENITKVRLSPLTEPQIEASPQPTSSTSATAGAVLENDTAPRYRSLFALRKQSTPDRICTLEAAVMLLHELGESEQVCAQLIQYLKIMVDRVRVTSRQRPTYDTIPTPSSDRSSRRRDRRNKGNASLEKQQQEQQEERDDEEPIPERDANDESEEQIDLQFQQSLTLADE